MNSWALASFAARSTSARVAPGRAKAMLSAMLRENRKMSCSILPMPEPVYSFGVIFQSKPSPACA